MKKKILIVTSLLLVLTVSVRIHLLYFTYGGKFDTNYTYRDLENNFVSREREIFEFRNYCNSIIPKDKLLMLRFDKRSDRYSLFIKNNTYDSKKQKNNTNVEWKQQNLKEVDICVLEIAKLLDCSTDELKVLLEKFKNTNCISVISSTYYNGSRVFRLTFRVRDLWFNYDLGYWLYASPFPTDENFKKSLNDKGLVFYRDSILFESW